MDFEKRIREIAEGHGANFFGIADLSTARDAVLDQGGQMIAQYPRAISVGIELLHPIVDELPNRNRREVSISYRLHCYDIINQRLDLIASHISSVLQKEGYRAFPVPASERVDDERICAIFSHKMAARLAGLGWIGKSCLLVTPEAGPRVRWVTVLTDAPLNATGKPIEDRCRECRECVNICPVRAFSGRPFDEKEPREARYDASVCERYLHFLGETTGSAVCGLCLYVCPYGKETVFKLFGKKLFSRIVQQSDLSSYDGHEKRK
ncbi:epoxyqueuosine reductase [Methanocella sp. CWC-04]|uniref:Epoxyqueuosine reductase n=1 Tax=Methanooceanicella nereidis TaxID=2052831 RepID=A0AAP2W593_9EURY|nr:4Fe-4S dicluster domain-containing protein [Methanocella sp. CWC-04]MCD1293937.1 epoxyqueuosine reductase [Methanocella sp. CWC-04]